MSEKMSGAVAPEHDPWYINPDKNPDTVPLDESSKPVYEEHIKLDEPLLDEIPSEDLELIEPKSETMEQVSLGLEFLGQEIHDLAGAAVDAVKRLEHPQTEEQEGLFRRLSGKVRARAATTFAAIALAGALSGPAPVEAGERGRKIAYAGAVIAGEVDRELQQSYYEAHQDAQQIENAMRRMEDDVNRFMYQHDQLTERIAQTDERIEDALQRNKPDQVRRLMHEKDGMMREQSTLKERADRRRGMIHQAQQDLIKAEKSATNKRRIGAGVRVLGALGQILAQR